ncbi:hypothetical protein PCCS19_07690 [Paenibacillus sp. CCS19]|nr:hypothetical protein PCCS19_07690 [Paenibacillus cellulosilyticus]
MCENGNDDDENDDVDVYGRNDVQDEEHADDDGPNARNEYDGRHGYGQLDVQHAEVRRNDDDDDEHDASNERNRRLRFPLFQGVIKHGGY